MCRESLKTKMVILTGQEDNHLAYILGKMTETKIRKKEADTSSGLFQLSLDQNRRELRPVAQNMKKAYIVVGYWWFQKTAPKLLLYFPT